ncbi:MAG: hypothetical protein ACRD0J_05995 [Acidimicrobiales bacterium]
MIEVAGGEPLLASAGVPSTQTTWDEIADADPEVVVFMPCGYDLQGAIAQAPSLLARPELARASAVYAADANGYYSCPGPRLVAGVEALAWALHEPSGIAPAPGALARLR